MAGFTCVCCNVGITPSESLRRNGYCHGCWRGACSRCTVADAEDALFAQLEDDEDDEGLMFDAD